LAENLPKDSLHSMLIKAYRVESRPHGSIAFDPPEPVLIGKVQFTGGIYGGMEESQLEIDAIELLANYSPLARDPVLGLETWEVVSIGIDDESLGTPSFQDISQGYRLWLQRSHI
jgi:hypothetical protein